MPELINETEITKIDTTAKVEALQTQIASVSSYKAFVLAKENEKSVVDAALAYWDKVIAKTKDPQAIAYRKKIAENPKWYIEQRAKDAQYALNVLAEQIAVVSKEIVN